MVNMRLPWLQEAQFVGFIRIKTVANFHKGTWKLRENITCG